MSEEHLQTLRRWFSVSWSELDDFVLEQFCILDNESVQHRLLSELPSCPASTPAQFREWAKNQIRGYANDSRLFDFASVRTIQDVLDLAACRPLEEPGLRTLPNQNQLFVWHQGGWSLRRHGNSKKDRGKKQIGKGNVFELYQLLAGCTPEEASNAIRYLDSTKTLAKDEWIDLAKVDNEVLGKPRAVAAVEGNAQ